MLFVQAEYANYEYQLTISKQEGRRRSWPNDPVRKTPHLLTFVQFTIQSGKSDLHILFQLAFMMITYLCCKLQANCTNHAMY
jgi:hypothetical protein